MDYIKSMLGYVSRASGYGVGNELVLKVQISLDAKEFNKIKKTQDPLAYCMAQIKNVVFDATNIRSIPSYAPMSYGQRYPRAKNGLVTLTVVFDLDQFTAKRLNIDSKDYFLSHKIDLQSYLEASRNEGHLFAKTAIETVLKKGAF